MSLIHFHSEEAGNCSTERDGIKERTDYFSAALGVG